MIGRKGMNPALARASQLSRDAVLLKAAHKVDKLIALNVLNDKFDFEREDMILFMEECNKMIEAYESGHVESVRDFEAVLLEEKEIVVE